MIVGRLSVCLINYLLQRSLERHRQLNAREAKYGGTAVYGINKFSDLTPEEFKSNSVQTTYQALLNKRQGCRQVFRGGGGGELYRPHLLSFAVPTNTAPFHIRKIGNEQSSSYVYIISHNDKVCDPPTFSMYFIIVFIKTTPTKLSKFLRIDVVKC